MRSLVSIIIPVYKAEEYLDRCVESVVQQTYRNIEVILVDDESPDSCPQKCDAWRAKDPRIKVVHKNNAGPGYARNSGLDIAEGEYVTFVDSDDYLAPDAIAIMVDRIEKDRSDLVIAQCVKVYSDGRKDTPVYHWISNEIIDQDAAMRMMGASQALPVYIWGKLYKRSIFRELRFGSLSCAEDVYVLPAIIEQCNTVSMEKSVLYYYFQRDTSIVHTRKLAQTIDSIFAALYVSRFLFDREYIEGASRYYYSALCQSYKEKGCKQIHELLANVYSKEEKKIIKKEWTNI